MSGRYIRRDGIYVGTVHKSGRYISRDGIYVGTIHKSGRYIRQGVIYVGTVHDLSVLYRHCYRPDQREMATITHPSALQRLDQSTSRKLIQGRTEDLTDSAVASLFYGNNYTV